MSGGILLEAAPHQPQPPAPPDTLIIHPPVIDAVEFQAVVRREGEKESSWEEQAVLFGYIYIYIHIYVSSVGTSLHAKSMSLGVEC